VSRDEQKARASAQRSPYAAPSIRLVELEVMASFPQNCKMDVGVGGFGGAAGPCVESGRPRVWCMQSGS
jgi:hypothetical protein